ncbi:MAG: hypothetical protein JWR32_2167 [Mycobacterium sp.]|nr:hypothetical protein [Mycobacterium sp.]
MTVTTEDLTGTEQAVLLILMAESRPVSNTELGALGPKLEKRSREKLNRLKLIETAQVGRGLVHELTDKGLRECGDLFGAEAPPRSSGQGKALYVVLAGLGRYLRRTDQRVADVFWPRDTAAKITESQIPAVGHGPGHVEGLVRDAYSRLARRPGGWVGLVRLRAELPHLARSDVDAALIRMYQEPGISLIPEENQKVLTTADREAAVEIGDQDKHLIAIQA